MLAGVCAKIITPAGTRWPADRPAAVLTLYVHGDLNRVPSSRGREREAGRNVDGFAFRKSLHAWPTFGRSACADSLLKS